MMGMTTIKPLQILFCAWCHCRETIATNQSARSFPELCLKVSFVEISLVDPITDANKVGCCECYQPKPLSHPLGIETIALPARVGSSSKLGFYFFFFLFGALSVITQSALCLLLFVLLQSGCDVGGA